LLDGTRVITAGSNDPAGDPILTTLDVDGHAVHLDAMGVAAIRLAPDGTLQALAAGGLKSVSTAALRIDLDTRLNLALWRDPTGTLRGTVTSKRDLPLALTQITPHWTRLEWE